MKRHLHRLRHLRQFVIYVGGGVVSALIDIGVMQWLLSLGWHVVAASSAGFLTGLLFNYMFHAKVTFSAMPQGRSFARYLALVAVNYLITVAMVSVAQSLFGSALAGKLASLPVVAVNGYLLGKYWIFKPAVGSAAPAK